MLRFPNAAHAAYDNSKDRAELFAWCVDYVRSSGLFAGTAAETALGLVSARAVQGLPAADGASFCRRLYYQS